VVEMQWYGAIVAINGTKVESLILLLGWPHQILVLKFSILYLLDLAPVLPHGSDKLHMCNHVKF
jgi:hypothetical protein